jgi:hypothetical protein
MIRTPARLTPGNLSTGFAAARLYAAMETPRIRPLEDLELRLAG